MHGKSLDAPLAAHVVQLFDAARSRAEATARYLFEGWEAGDQLLVIAKPAHWALIADYLERHGCPARDAASRPRIHVVDALAALRRMRRRGVFVRDAAHQVIAEIIQEASASGRPLRVYGEVVDLLAEEGAFDEACTLEAAWNTALTGGLRARLLCGYTAAHFTDPRHASWLGRICSHHSHVETHSADTLGTWLTASLAPAR